MMNAHLTQIQVEIWIYKINCISYGLKYNLIMDGRVRDASAYLLEANVSDREANTQIY